MLYRFSMIFAMLLLLQQSVAGQVRFEPLVDLGFGATANDINGNGVIVGSVVADASLRQQPAIWENAQATPVQLPSGGLGGFAIAANDIGQVVGAINLEVGAGNTPALWDLGVLIDLPTLGEGGAAQDINNAGVIVGYVNSSGSQLPAVWEAGELRLLPLPEFGEPGDQFVGSANSINSNGEITGTLKIAFGSDSIALRWIGDSVSTVGLARWLETRAVDSNDQGSALINGYFDPNGSFELAIFRGENDIQFLPSPNEYSPVWGTALSPNEIAVGYFGDFTDGIYRLRAVAWVNGALESLELPEGFRWSLPIGVSSDGTVVGYISDGLTGNSIAGFWKIGLESQEPTTLRTAVASGLPGATVNLTGRLINRTTRLPIRNAIVTMNHGGRELSARTNAAGRFSMRITIPPKQPSKTNMRMEIYFHGTNQLQPSKANATVQVR